MQIIDQEILHIQERGHMWTGGDYTCSCYHAPSPHLYIKMQIILEEILHIQVVTTDYTCYIHPIPTGTKAE
jgi:hypothetical protein